MQSNNGNGMFGALLLEAPHNSRESSWCMVYRNISWLMTGGLQQSVRGFVMTGLLNASLAIRRVIADPNCASCGVPETNEHCLLDCPAFAVPRLQCSLGLSMLSVDLDLSSVLGDVDRPKSSQDRRPTAVRCEILKLTGAFLRDIDLVRQPNSDFTFLDHWRPALASMTGLLTLPKSLLERRLRHSWPKLVGCRLRAMLAINVRVYDCALRAD